MADAIDPSGALHRFQRSLALLEGREAPELATPEADEIAYALYEMAAEFRGLSSHEDWKEVCNRVRTARQQWPRDSLTQREFLAACRALVGQMGIGGRLIGATWSESGGSLRLPRDSLKLA